MKFLAKYKTIVRIALIIAIVVLVVFLGVISRKRYIDTRRQDARVMMHAYQENLLMKMQRELNYAHDLATSISPDSLDLDQFQTLVSDLLARHDEVEYVDLIIGDTLSYVMPSDIYGEDVGMDISNFRYVYTLTKVMGQLVVEGPVSLRRTGKEAFLFFQPIMKDSQYWGQVSVALEKDYVLEQLHLSYLLDSGYDYELWRVDPQSGGKDVVARSGTDVDFSDAVQIVLYLPTQWNLNIIPQGGWITSRDVWIITVFCILLSAIMLAFLFSLFVSLDRKRRLEEISLIDLTTGLYNQAGLIHSLDGWISKGDQLF